MNWADDFEFADFGAKPENVLAYSGGRRVFHSVTLEWHEPVNWLGKAARPSWERPDDMKRLGLYAILRDHGHNTQPNQIEYIGMAKSLFGRLDTKKHTSAAHLSHKKGRTRVSVVFLNAGKGSESRAKEIEDILIWTFWKTIINKAGLTTLPSMRVSSGKGSKLSRPWIINNKGYHFEGQMPQQIVYPWILTSNARVGAR